MPAWGWVVVAVAVVLVVVAAVLVVLSKRRTAGLRARFGPEYDRALATSGHKRDAEAELKGRQERRSQFQILDLNPATRQRYQHDWRTVQSQFVDDPVGAIRGADSLIQSVMLERGYPVQDFDQRADDLSVDHPEVVQNYRQGHRLATGSYGSHKASTEDLRQAMWHYRALFEELVETGRASRQNGQNGTGDAMTPTDEVSHSSTGRQDSDRPR